MEYKQYCFIFLFLCVCGCVAGAPEVQSVEYFSKTVELLGSTLELGVIEVNTNEDLYFLNSVACPPYQCSNENLGCVCDYSQLDACGTSSPEGCSSCDNKEEFCGEGANAWTSLQNNVSDYFVVNGETLYFRYFHNEPCKGVRVCERSCS
jgi:hypothetical protein